MADKNKDRDLTQQQPEHHSKLKGAAIGGAAGEFIAGKPQVKAVPAER